MNTKLNQILAEISAGELLDKITILEIKKENIKKKEKSKSVKAVSKTILSKIKSLAAKKEKK